MKLPKVLATHRTRLFAIAFCVLASLSAAELFQSTVLAQDAKSPLERKVFYRTSLFHVLAGNFGPVHEMADGKQPFDQAEAEKRVERAVFLARMTDEAFSADTNGVFGTKARPDIWKKPAEFEQARQALVDKLEALQVAVKGSDRAKLKAAADAAGDTCGGCHKQFKMD